MSRNYRLLATVTVLMTTMLMLSPAGLRAADKDEKSDDFGPKFIKDAAERMLGEIELSRIVPEYSHSEGVKHYAELQLKYYRQLLNDVRDVAAKKDYKEPTEMSDRQKDAMKRLKDAKSTEFDMQYLSDQLDEQQSLIDLFKRASTDSSDHKLRTFATDRIPDLQAHYDNARELYRKIKAKDMK